MASKVIQLFSVPVYAGYLETLTDELKEFIVEQQYELMYSGKGWYTVNQQLLHHPKLKIVKEEVDSHVEIFAQEVLKIKESQEFYLTTSWALKHHQGDFAGSHSHTNSMISGVFYLNQDENFGDLVIERNFDNVFSKTIDPSYTEFTPLNSGKWSFQPIANTILLFPSITLHSVTPNKSNNTRYSVAFNYFIKGEFGHKESKLFL